MRCAKRLTGVNQVAPASGYATSPARLASWGDHVLAIELAVGAWKVVNHVGSQAGLEDSGRKMWRNRVGGCSRETG